MYTEVTSRLSKELLFKCFGSHVSTQMSVPFTPVLPLPLNSVLLEMEKRVAKAENSVFGTVLHRPH
jgi:hypothetical protein